MDILSLGKDELINLDPEKVKRMITLDELFHIAKTLNNLWFYDWDTLSAGKKGEHAELKSGLCSDKFINLKGILKTYPNIRKIVAYHISCIILDQVKRGMKMPTHIVGVPDAATELGEDVANILGVKLALASKSHSGKIMFLTRLADTDILLLIEDVCSKATGIKETIQDAVDCKSVKMNSIIPVEIVYFKRGCLDSFIIEGVEFKIVAALEHQMNEWMPKNASNELRLKHPDAEPCPLCKLDVKRRRPKKTEEDWIAITTSQL